jgi:hypothetical protein
METPIIVALVGFAGLITGSGLTYFLNRKTEYAKQFQLLRTQAYVDFIKGWAGMGRSQFFGDKEKELEYTILTVESKARISIYGSEKVVKKLAEFIREYNETISQEGAKSYSELINIMRNESIGVEDSITKDNITTINVGKDFKKINGKTQTLLRQFP